MKTPRVPIVMLVEDDADSREMYTTWLELSGFRVVAVGDARVGLGLIQAERPSVIITDLRMPGLDGVEFCRLLKTTAGTADIPVIAVTGMVTERDAASAREAGVDRVLLKPCPPDEVSAAIVELLGTRPQDGDGSAALAAPAPPGERRRDRSGRREQVLQCRAAATAGQHATVACPSCGAPIAWVDSNTAGGMTFDYFAACPNGCGEHCFDHARKRFVRLR